MTKTAVGIDSCVSYIVLLRAEPHPKPVVSLMYINMKPSFKC